MTIQDWKRSSFDATSGKPFDYLLRGLKTMSIWANKDQRTTIIAVGFVFVLVSIIAFFSFFEVPEANRDLVIAFTSILATGGTIALKFLFDGADAELAKVVAENKSLKLELATVKGELDRLTRMLVERHVIDGEGFVSPRRIEDHT